MTGEYCIPEDDKEKRMLVKPLSEDVERYPISDARIMFDSEKQRDEFRALLEKEGENDTRRLCYNCLHCDLNHPAPGEFARCRRDGRQVYNSLYANLCDYYLEKER